MAKDLENVRFLLCSCGGLRPVSPDAGSGSHQIGGEVVGMSHELSLVFSKYRAIDDGRVRSGRRMDKMALVSSAV